MNTSFVTPLFSALGKGYVSVKILSPRARSGPMTLGLLKNDKTMYPMTPTAIKLLIVMLTTMAAHADSTPKTDGGGKYSQR